MQLTADTKARADGSRTRQSVIGVLGFRRAILLLHKGVEKFSNAAGLEHLAFKGDAIGTTFEKLKGVLVREKQIPER